MTPEESSGLRRRFPSYRQAFPLVFFGLICIALGIWSRSAEPFATIGQFPLWPYLIAVGSIALAGGTATSLVEWEDLEVDVVGTTSGHILVPREDWLAWQRTKTTLDAPSGVPAVAPAPPPWLETPAPARASAAASAAATLAPETSSFPSSSTGRGTSPSTLRPNRAAAPRVPGAPSAVPSSPLTRSYASKMEPTSGSTTRPDRPFRFQSEPVPPAPPQERSHEPPLASGPSVLPTAEPPGPKLGRGEGLRVVSAVPAGPSSRADREPGADRSPIPTPPAGPTDSVEHLPAPPVSVPSPGSSVPETRARSPATVTPSDLGGTDAVSEGDLEKEFEDLLHMLEPSASSGMGGPTDASTGPRCIVCGAQSLSDPGTSGTCGSCGGLLCDGCFRRMSNEGHRGICPDCALLQKRIQEDSGGVSPAL